MNINPKLIQKCRKGDRRAQFELYRACFPLLMSICIRYQKNQDDAKAILNTGFLKVLNHIDRFKENEIPFSAWIRRIMINTIIDEYRKQKKEREKVRYTDFSMQEGFDHHFDLNEAYKQFEVEDIEMCIKQLPPVSQKVFNLYIIDGFKHKEIGEMLEISPGTSKWHLSHARKELRKMLTERMNAPKLIRNN